MKIGYARVSTDDQNLNLQMDALRRAGCETIFTDQGLSGTTFNRPGLDKALCRLKSGETLVVWRLDRLGRSLIKLIDLISLLEKRNVKFESLTEKIATDSPAGVLLFHMIAALAQFERSLISERTKAGMRAAKERGQKLGRKNALTKDQKEKAKLLLETQTISSVAQHFGVNSKTISRLANKERSAIGRQISQ
ncbi:recombinase family protein [Burkholderia cepacia]|uniref:recombinase family protein n=1 Tax=Burkholderia cepacia TaxID=292 RepID=UPI0009C08DCD|nr:recombinase family protein [Burkholderia cepacia]